MNENSIMVGDVIAFRLERRSLDTMEVNVYMSNPNINLHDFLHAVLGALVLKIKEVTDLSHDETFDGLFYILECVKEFFEILENESESEEK